MSVFDEKFASCRAEVVQQKKDMVLGISKWMGTQMSEETECGQHVAILGIIFDFGFGVLAIKPTRWEDLKFEITQALEEDWARCAVSSCSPPATTLAGMAEHTSSRLQITSGVLQEDSPWRLHCVDRCVLGCNFWIQSLVRGHSLARLRRGLLILSCSPMGRIPTHGMSRGCVACIKGKSPMEDQVLYTSWVVTLFYGGKVVRRRNPDRHG